MGGFFQLLYNGSFGAGHQICICHKDWELDTGGDWIIFKQEKSGRINFEQDHLEKASLTMT